MGQKITFTIPTTGVGRPDYSQPVPVGQSPKGAVYTSMDVGELAARLGSPMVTDRRGDVIFMENFDNGIEFWELETSGAGASISWSAEHALRGGFSMKMVAGSNLLRYAKVIGHLGFPYLSRLGMELAWTESANNERVDGQVSLFTGEYELRWGFYHTPADGRTYILEPTGWRHILTGKAYVTDYLFAPVKIVIDPLNMKYYRLVSGPVALDLSPYYCAIVPDVTFPRMEWFLQLTSKPGTNATIYLDDLIITQNEPENTALYEIQVSV